ncbi:MFS general substrate transporter [Marasmius fiardii PR-910]|nr:MFS general substrate transporter [Marasmius fiardii PR-910]
MAPSQAQLPNATNALRKRVLWKLDCHILPYLTLLWLVNYLDRSNVGNARVLGLEQDLGLHGRQFNVALLVFYVSYLLVDVPATLLLKRIKPNRWIPSLVMAWGFVTVMTCFVRGFVGLAGIRFCLGLFEGGLLPCMLLYLSNMYPKECLFMRIGIFFAGASLAGAFGGLLSYGIINMDGLGGLAGWRWIFIIEGIVTILAGALALFTLPVDLNSASFLSEEEKQYALSSVLGVVDDSTDDNEKAAGLNETVESLETEGEVFEMREFWRGLFDVQTWLTSLGALACTVTLYSYALFLPTILTGLGYSGKEAQLLVVPPAVPAAFLTVLVAYLSDRWNARAPFILALLPLPIAGYTMMILSKSVKVRYAAVFLITTGLYPSTAGILALLPNNTGGHYKRATAIGFQIGLSNFGGFVATLVYTSDQYPRYVKGHSVVLSFMCLGWFVVAINMLYCMFENKARKEGRRGNNLTRYRELLTAGKTRAPIGDRHPDFRFVL